MINKHKKQYWAYARVSTYKQQQHNTITEQTKPLRKWLSRYYHSQNQINKHLYHETYTGTTMARPKFKAMLKHVKPGDTLCFYRLDRMSRSLSSAVNFITTCKNNNIKIHILKTGTNFDPTTKIGEFTIDLFILFSDFEHQLIVDRMDDGKRKAKAMHKPNWNGGIAPRFYGKKRRYYIGVYKYTKDHSIKDTSIRFNMGTSTVSRIKRDGKIYFANKKSKHQNPNQTKFKHNVIKLAKQYIKDKHKLESSK